VTALGSAGAARVAVSRELSGHPPSLLPQAEFHPTAWIETSLIVGRGPPGTMSSRRLARKQPASFRAEPTSTVMWEKGASLTGSEDGPDQTSAGPIGWSRLLRRPGRPATRAGVEHLAHLARQKVSGEGFLEIGDSGIEARRGGRSRHPCIPTYRARGSRAGCRRPPWRADDRSSRA